MTCLYLGQKEQNHICQASFSLMTPGLADLTKYCESEEHCDCPMLLGHLFRNEFRRPKAARVRESVSYGR